MFSSPTEVDKIRVSESLNPWPCTVPKYIWIKISIYVYTHVCMCIHACMCAYVWKVLKAHVFFFLILMSSYPPNISAICPYASELLEPSYEVNPDSKLNQIYPPLISVAIFNRNILFVISQTEHVSITSHCSKFFILADQSGRTRSQPRDCFIFHFSRVDYRRKGSVT